MTAAEKRQRDGCPVCGGPCTDERCQCDPEPTAATTPDRAEIALDHLMGAIRREAEWDESHYSAAVEIVYAFQQLQKERDALMRYLGISHMWELPSGTV